VSRSLLFVPGDSERKFASACSSTADALILDLEDSVSPDQKGNALALTRQFLKSAPPAKDIWVRINALDSGRALEDLAGIVPLQPFGVVLPKCAGRAGLLQLAHYLDAIEACSGTPRGKTRILAIMTETAEAIFRAGEYKAVTERLWGLSWGAEDLAADIAAEDNRVAGRYTEPFRLARSLCLFAAAAARVRAVDTVCVDLNDADVLNDETCEARRDGFSAKMVIHPRHVNTVNDVFTPTEEQLRWAHSVVAAFDGSPNAGALNLDGKMIDMPHLRLARRLLGKEL